MIPNLTTFVLLACACVTINAAIILPVSQACMKIRKGSTAGFEHHERPIILSQEIVDWEMPLPKCVGETGGIDVAVCDDYKIPDVKFTNSSTVVVHRISSTESFIIVQITLHCLSPQDQQSGKIPPPLLKK